LGHTAPAGNVVTPVGKDGALFAAAPSPGTKSSHKSEQNGHVTRATRGDAAVARARTNAADST
jgi:hypothetical protein